MYYTFFGNSPTGQTVRPLNGFSCSMAQNTWLHARMCLLE